MKQMLTAKLKLHTTPEQFQALRRAQLAYRDALNYVSRYSFAQGKKSNQQWLQRETYDEIRLRFHCLPKWRAMFPGRSERLTKACGRRSERMRKHTKQAIPRNVTRDWMRLPSMCPPRSPTTTSMTTVSKNSSTSVS